MTTFNIVEEFVYYFDDTYIVYNVFKDGKNIARFQDKSLAEAWIKWYQDNEEHLP